MAKKRIYYRDDGYMMEFSPWHPFAHKSGYAFQHRLAMEEKIGRLLWPWEHIHHLNDIPWDNRPENLALMTLREHKSMHARRQHGTPYDFDTILRHLVDGMTYPEIAKMYGRDKSTIVQHMTSRGFYKSRDLLAAVEKAESVQASERE